MSERLDGMRERERQVDRAGLDGPPEDEHHLHRHYVAFIQIAYHTLTGCHTPSFTIKNKLWVKDRGQDLMPVILLQILLSGRIFTLLVIRLRTLFYDFCFFLL